MGEVHPVVRKEGLLVAEVSPAQLSQERVAAPAEILGLDQLLGNLVEVALQPLYSPPLRAPTAEVGGLVGVLLMLSEYPIEVLEYKQELGQVVERLVGIAQGVRCRYSSRKELQSPWMVPTLSSERSPV